LVSLSTQPLLYFLALQQVKEGMEAQLGQLRFLTFFISVEKHLAKLIAW